MAPFVLLSMDTLVKHCNPLNDPPWENTEFLTVEDIAAAVNSSRLNPVPWSVKTEFGKEVQATVTYHAERIAYFVVNGIPDPICIDVGCPDLGLTREYILDDGNHRLAAAIMRGDTHIAASIAGDVDYAMELFGIDITSISQ